MHISSSVWSVQHPNAGRNIQHVSACMLIKCVVRLPSLILPYSNFTKLCLYITKLKSYTSNDKISLSHFNKFPLCYTKKLINTDPLKMEF